MIQPKIERRFLLKALPASLKLPRGNVIEEGFMAHDNSREILLSRADGEHFLSYKEGKFPSREIKVSLSPSQFALLWQSTEGRRLEKTRYRLKDQNLLITIDQFAAELSSLFIVGVRFPNVEASAAFKAPDYFDKDITEEQDYEKFSLALHGLPHDSGYPYQIAALPYLFKEGKLHLVIVMNSVQSKWIIPKGNPEQGMTHHDVAIMESMEEAGVIGNCEPSFRTQCKIKGEKVLYVYPLRVSTVLKKWPESAWRKRAVLPLEEALRSIKDAELSQSVERLAARLV